MMESLLDDAFELLELATKLEEDTPIEASTKYYESVYLLRRFLQVRTVNIVSLQVMLGCSLI